MKKGLKKLTANALKSSRFFLALTLACMLGVVGSVQAQEEGSSESTESSGKKESKITLGVRTGLNLSSFSIAGNRSNYLPGGQAGAFLNIKATKWVTLSAEAAWAQNGAAGITAPNNAAITHNFNTNNFQGNILTYFKLPVLSVYEPKLFIGPSFDYVGHVASNTESRTNYVKTRYDVSKNFKKFDLGLIVGLGVDFDLKFARLFLDARYRQGLLDINDYNVTNIYTGTAAGLTTFDETNPAAAVRNSTVSTGQFSFQVGLGFDL
jgi:hypothetical protein